MTAEQVKGLLPIAFSASAADCAREKESIVVRLVLMGLGSKVPGMVSNDDCEGWSLVVGGGGGDGRGWWCR